MRNAWKSIERLAAVVGLGIWMLGVPAQAQETVTGDRLPAAPGGRLPATPGGEALYTQLCASCHGAEGRGDGTVSDEVLLRPRDFALNAFKFDTDADWQRGTDADLANVIRNGTAVYGGSPLMPPWSSLSEEEVAALVAHIRMLQSNGGG